jgi:hypothetical protein
MAFTASIADAPAPRRGFPQAILVALAAVGSSLAVAAWMADSDLPKHISAALPGNGDRVSLQVSAQVSSFEDRFFPAPMARSAVSNAVPAPLKRPSLAIAETTSATAQSLFDQRFASMDLLDRRFASLDLRTGFSDNDVRAGATSSAAAVGIPLPRSRPVAANLDAHPGSAFAQTDSARPPADRSLLQKLSDLLPGRVTLASLAPEGGLFRRGPDLASLGYDNLTAVYDISAHSVYLPNGSVLEAHSGLGNLRDDPEHVFVPNAGATPPAVYDLKLREKEFHGVQALRMIPVEGSETSGRSGLLAHSFMLGPNGDSNGCVSIKDYDRFLKAFNDGAINRLVVVPSLRSGTLASQGPTSRS